MKGQTEGSAEVQPQVANAQASPVLDEPTFQHILQAAYIIQEQNDRRREPRRTLDPAATLAIIAETQELLRSQIYDVNAAAQLIAERLQRVTNATGVAVAVIEEDQLRYCAALGACAPLAASTGPIGAGVSELLREEAVAPDDVHAELFETNENSPAYFPVCVEGRIAGLLQLSFPETESIQEHEIRSCQLMAGLIGETISRVTELEWKQSLAAERATMLEALEQLRPQLERLAAGERTKSTEASAEDQSGGDSSSSNVLLTNHIAPQPKAPPISGQPESLTLVGDSRLSPTCGNCGFHFSDGEMFCGRCGTPRKIETPLALELPFESAPEEPNPQSEIQLVTTIEETRDVPPEVIGGGPVPVVAESPTVQVAAIVPAVEGSAALAIEHQPTQVEDALQEQKADLEIVAEPVQVAAPSPWSSAIKTRKWLASLQKADSQWLVKHSGDVSIVVAALVLLIVLTGWNTHPTLKKGARSNTPSLTLFERMLVGLGLAEAPPTPVYSGNPDAQVWEDLHTGLYYCAGAELFGKTPGGKVTSQRDAQLDQFEPAARKTCE